MGVTALGSGPVSVQGRQHVSRCVASGEREGPAGQTSGDAGGARLTRGPRVVFGKDTEIEAASSER